MFTLMFLIPELSQLWNRFEKLYHTDEETYAVGVQLFGGGSATLLSSI